MILASLASAKPLRHVTTCYHSVDATAVCLMCSIYQICSVTYDSIHHHVWLVVCADKALCMEQTFSTWH